MSGEIIRQNASEYIETADVKDVLDDHDHNFGDKRGWGVLEGEADVEGEDNPVDYGVAKIGAIARADDMLRDGVIEVLRPHGVQSAPQYPYGSIVGSALAGDTGSAKHRDFDARDFGDFYQEILERESQVGPYSDGSDTAAATAVAISAVDRALEKEIPGYTRHEDSSADQMHQEPSSDGYIEEVANDAEARAFEPKSFSKRVVEKLS